MNTNLSIHSKYVLNQLDIIQNIELSIVLPFYKKYEEFKTILSKNALYFQRNGIEVIVSMDEDSQEKELIELIKQYPLINWKVIVNRVSHDWRNPVRAINVGIRSATKKYILVCSPESEFLTDAIYQMRSMLEQHDIHYAIGTVTFQYENDQTMKNSFFLPYGSIMMKRDDTLKIRGYDESLDKWGGDDDNIRARLDLCGIRKLFMPEVKLLHRENDKRGFEKRMEKRAQIPIELEKKIFYPSEISPNNIDWGRDFNEIIYDWRNNKYSYELIYNYARQFDKYEITYPDIFLKKHHKIVLVSSYNEGENIVSFLNNMSQYFDGIILLDDGSTDDTYELARDPKLLIKVKKKRDCFNDIENRNIKLDLASFVSSEWFCFMDTDERFCKPFDNFDLLENTKADIISFSFVHIWKKNTDNYNGEYPYSDNGIVSRMKMFRNIGHCQIHSNKEKMHFAVIPYQTNVVSFPILYKHFGMDSIEKRDAKYKLYQKEDTSGDQKDYSHIIKHNSKLLDFKDIKYINSRFINSAIFYDPILTNN